MRHFNMLAWLHKWLLYEMNGGITGEESLNNIGITATNLEDPENQRERHCQHTFGNTKINYECVEVNCN